MKDRKQPDVVRATGMLASGCVSSEEPLALPACCFLEAAAGADGRQMLAQGGGQLAGRSQEQANIEPGLGC